MALLIAGSLALPAAASTLNLNAELISLHQLPKGFVSASYSSSIGLLPSCNTTSLGAAPTAQAGAAFGFGSAEGSPSISESLTEYKNIDAAFDALSSKLKGCAHLTGSKNGTPYVVTVGSISFSHYGNQSAAFAFKVDAQSFSESGYLVVVREGELADGTNRG